MMKSLLLLPLMVAVVMGGAVELGKDNFEDALAGKSAFVKFLAPWCGHCKKMKPTWDQLGDEYKDSTSVVIADVDCTIEKDLCSQYDVRGYPTIKYFTSSTAATGDKYEGGRDFAALKEFVDENLGPSCGAENPDLCSDEQRAVLDGFLAMTADERAAIVTEKSQAIADAEENFKTEVDALQKRYQDLSTEKEATIAEITPNLRLLRTIKAPEGKDEL